MLAWKWHKVNSWLERKAVVHQHSKGG